MGSQRGDIGIYKFTHFQTHAIKHWDITSKKQFEWHTDEMLEVGWRGK